MTGKEGKLLVLGADGQVGRALQAQPPVSGVPATFLERHGLDITDREAVVAVINEISPAIIVNAAAYTDVDGAETDAKTAFAVNRDGPAYLAEACAGEGVPLIHLSTDFVFDGGRDRPYREDDSPAPLGAYGQSKADGEAAIRARLDHHIIVRTSWLFSPYRGNFVKSILRLSGERDDLRVVDDQIGGPTEATDVATAVIAMATAIVRGKEDWGTYHYCGAPAVSRHAFAVEIVNANRRFQDPPPRVTPIKTADYPTTARRPAKAILDCSRIRQVFGIKQADWRPGLERVVDVLGREGQ